MRTYTIKPHQKTILKEIKQLPTKNMHYLVVQQSLKHSNLTLNELKKHIKRGIKIYIKKMFGHTYKEGIENDIIKYYCIFETSKEFFWSQHLNNIIDEDVKMNIHFHLFYTSSYNFVNYTHLTHNLFNELTSQKNKQRALTKFDYKSIETLEDDFILYHTKQMLFRPNREMLLVNI